MDVNIAQRGDRFELVVNPMDGLKKKWRGKFKGGETTDQYLKEIRGEVE
jgi:hypothetical protein